MQFKQFALIAPLVLACASALPVGDESKLQTPNIYLQVFQANRFQSGPTFRRTMTTSGCGRRPRQRRITMTSGYGRRPISRRKASLRRAMTISGCGRRLS
jgi:hypothetical protein